MVDDAPIPFFTIVPAQPGFQVAFFIPAAKDEDGKEQPPSFSLEPVIAWMIEHRRFHHSTGRGTHERVHEVIPLTVDGHVTQFTDNDWAIMLPDGRVTDLDTTYATEQSALKAMQAAEDKRKVARATKAATPTKPDPK